MRHYGCLRKRALDLKRTPQDALALLDQHGRRLYALLVRLTLRSDVADDLLQDLFVKLARSDGFARAANKLAYAYRAATNLAFDWRRTAKRNATSPIDGAPASAISTTNNAPWIDLAHREEIDRILTALEQLAALGRDIVIMRYLQQESYETIAAHLGNTPHQTRALAHKAIKQLRAVLGEQPLNSNLNKPDNSAEVIHRGT